MNPHVAVPAVVVEEALGAVLAVGDPGDALAQHPLGVVHELVGGGEHGVHPVALQQLVEAPHPEPGRRDLGVEVVLELALGAAVALDVRLDVGEFASHEDDMKCYP